MRKSRFTESQIIHCPAGDLRNKSAERGMIKEQAAGMPSVEVCRKRDLSQGAFYKLNSMKGAMEVSDAAKLRALGDENAKLKRLLSDQMLDSVMLKEFLGQN